MTAVCPPAPAPPATAPRESVATPPPTRGAADHRASPPSVGKAKQRAARAADSGATRGPGQHARLWQHPFVDVLKTFAPTERRGAVSVELDKTIAKQVMCIRGSVSANNFVQLPPSSGSLKTLGLTGEYVYLQLRPIDARFFVAHLDFTVATTSTLRVSLSNLYSEAKTTHNTVQCPCRLPPQWSVVCVHVPSVLELRGPLPSRALALKSLQLCASLCVRGVFTSDIRYAPDDLPRGLMLDHLGSFKERFAWVDLPGDVAADVEGTQSARPAAAGPSPRADVYERAAEASSSGGPPRTGLPRAPLGQSAVQPACAARAEDGSPGRDLLLLSGPAIRVKHFVGVSKANRSIADLPRALPRRFAVFLRGGSPPARADGTDRGGHVEAAKSCGAVLCASSMGLVLVDPAARSHRCYFGHSRAVELLEASEDGHWAASVQGSEGQEAPVVRFWRVEDCGALRCACVLPVPAFSSVRAASFDPLARHFALAGVDPQGRQHVNIYDVGRLAGGGNVSLVARQVSADWDIDCLSFSPLEELQFATCGRENIRFWRVKAGHLPGRNVVLNSLAQSSHFTCIAFEFNRSGSPSRLGERSEHGTRVLVGTADGKMLVLSYPDPKIQAVYHLHNGAITSVCANKALVVTASADKYVRVWPPDFKCFYLHAMHDSPMVGVDLAEGGLQVLCAAADGSVGLIDVHSHVYTDLARSHSAPIRDAAVSHLHKELVTASADGMLKIWSLCTMTQTHEFRVADDEPLVVAFHPGGRRLLAVGFQSGSMRLFDVGGPEMLFECRHHSEAVKSLAFVSASSSSSGQVRTFICTCDVAGTLIFCDEAQSFEVLKRTSLPPVLAPADGCSVMACVPPRLAMHHDRRSALLLTFPELEHVCKLRVPGSSVTSMDFAGGRFVVLGSSDSKVHLFDMMTGGPCATYAVTGGPITTIGASEPAGFTSPARQKPAALALLASTSDARLHVAWARAGDLECPRAPGATDEVEPGHLAGTGLAAPAAQDLLGEQCFMGHAVAPHRLIVTPACLVTVSSSEVICWESPGDVLPAAAAEASPPDAEGPPAIIGAVSGALEEQRQPRPECLEDCSAPQPLAADDPRALPEREEQHQPQTGRLDGEPAPQALAAEDLEALPAQEGGLDAQATAEQAPAAPEGAAASSPAPEAGARASRGGPAAESLARTRMADLKLSGVYGCDVAAAGAQAFAWSPSLGVLCHSIGGAVQVERFGGGIESESGLVEDAHLQSTQLASIPGSVVCSIDLDPHGGAILAGVSVDKPADGTSCAGGAWLTVWCLDSLCQTRQFELPGVYARPAQGCERPPLLRLLGGARGAVTGAASVTPSRGRVDIWDLREGRCGAPLGSAELEHVPRDLLLLAGGAEFLTLGLGALTFWQCPDSSKEDGVPVDSLQFQPAEFPPCEVSGTLEFASLCLSREAGEGGSQLLVAGTSDGLAWVWDAGENRLLGCAGLCEGQRIDAIACSRWPLLVCGAGGALHSFTLGRAASPEAADLPTQRAAPAVQLDGAVTGLQLGGSAGDECIVATTANTVWYVHLGAQERVPLRSFHAAPSRALASSMPTHAQGPWASGQAAPLVVASGSDDGCVLLWSCGNGAGEPQPAARVAGASACTAVAFVGPEWLVCGFSSGSLSVFSLHDLSVAEHTQAEEGSSPVAGLAATSAISFVCGTAAGSLLEFQITAHSVAASSSGDPEPSRPRLVARRASGVPHPCRPICHVDADCSGPACFLACFANRELRVWERPAESAAAARLWRTWRWPDREHELPAPAAHNAAGPAGAAPLMASLVPGLPDGGGRVVVSTPSASWLYIYGLRSGGVVGHAALAPGLRGALRLWPWTAATSARSHEDGAVVFVIGASCFARLQLCGYSAEAKWLEKEPLRIPGSEGDLGAGPLGIPSACCLPGVRGGSGAGPWCDVLLKGDRAFSRWSMCS